MANAPDVLATANKIPKVMLASSTGLRSMPLHWLRHSSEQVRASCSENSGILTAIKLGYGHFDTASMYSSEQTLGEAIQETLGLGLNLQLKYLDLYLIHWPIRYLMPMDFKAVWAAMEECQRLGLTKSIGLGNFSTKKIENILSFTTIPPYVNQKLRDFCKAIGIIVTAFSPLGGIGSSWGSNHVFKSKVLQEIAEEWGKTNAQVGIRCVYQAGATLAVKSYNKERLKQNLREDLVSANGPSHYKSLEDLWDGEPFDLCYVSTHGDGRFEFRLSFNIKERNTITKLRVSYKIYKF
ncbi:non-functional NADPH-dependent codeinone reductase 2-like [Pyrus ussuriensis x Pyrus communis]|uniref:Non-functional NADPH-dependent codeinone reductase 2-like n=1 Tax=Pyrus ussuriensis x Pyrus communis TaxID=2448454 RepID=A0A5N5FPZ7_9ROSA|nr:non-functional NADPH-dependent codeinone reductase 2-like [Pyrus ussuriensis x Pyrus communis]